MLLDTQERSALVNLCDALLETATALTRLGLVSTPYMPGLGKPLDAAARDLKALLSRASAAEAPRAEDLSG